MKTKRLLLGVFVALISLCSNGQTEIKRFGFELSGGPSIATREIVSGKLKTGLGFEGIFHYRLRSHIGVYAGWGWNKFAAEATLLGSDTDFEETGYVFGLQYKHILDGSALSYFLRAGGLYNHIEVENGDGHIIGDTGHGLGFQFAAGVDIPLSLKWSFTSGLKYNSISGSAGIEAYQLKMDYHYLSVRLGILKKF